MGCPTPRARNARPARRQPVLTVAVTHILCDVPTSTMKSAPTRGLLGFSLRRTAEPVLVGFIPRALLGHSRPADQRHRHDVDTAHERACYSRVRHPARPAVHGPHGRFSICLFPRPTALFAWAERRSLLANTALRLRPTAPSVCARRRCLFAPNGALRLLSTPCPTPLSVCAQRCLPSVLDAALRLLSVCAPRRALLRRPPCTAYAQRRSLLSPIPAHYLRSIAQSACTPWQSPLALNGANYLRPTVLSVCVAQWCSPHSLGGALHVHPMVLSACAPPMCSFDKLKLAIAARASASTANGAWCISQ
jgi:hypothetical protein